MASKITAVHERVDDLPVIIALLFKLRVAELLDKHFPTNGNRTGLSLGQMCVIWLTFILSQADHRLNQVEPWVAEHQVTLSRCLGCEVSPRDCTDDRLATGLDYLNVSQSWQAFEADLNSLVIRTYDLKTARVRLDTTTAAAAVTPEGLFQFGHSKDHRPDLPQLKISLSVLDPIGLPLTTTVVAGNAADDPLYLPEIARVRQSIGHSGLLHIGDGKLGSLENRADIVAHKDYYLCPLSQIQVPAAELDRLLEPVFAGRQPLLDVYPPAADSTMNEEPDLDERIAVGFEMTMRVSGKDQSGKKQTWDERRLVVRSLSFASAQTLALDQRIKRAQQEIAALNERKQGKPRLESQAQAQAAAHRIAETRGVAEYLRIEVECQVAERSKRAYGSRPATTVREESLLVQTQVNEQAREQAVRRLGSPRLRDQSEGPRVAFGEGGVGVSRAVPDRARLLTLERLPVIADAFLFAVRTSDRRLDPALDHRAARAGAGAIGGAGKAQRTRGETLRHLRWAARPPDRQPDDRNDVARFSRSDSLPDHRRRRNSLASDAAVRNAKVHPKTVGTLNE